MIKPSYAELHHRIERLQAALAALQAKNTRLDMVNTGLESQNAALEACLRALVYAIDAARHPAQGQAQGPAINEARALLANAGGK